MSFDWTPYLDEGEEVLWQGRPDGRLVLFLTGIDFFLVPFLWLFWMFALLVLIGVALGTATDGLAFVLYGMLWVAYFFPGRAILDRRKRRALRYAITPLRDQRKTQLTERTISPELHIGTKDRRLPTIELDRYKGAGKATAPQIPLILGYKWNGSASAAPMDPRIGMLLGYVEYGFELRRLKDGREVAKLLRRLRDEATP